MYQSSWGGPPAFSWGEGFALPTRPPHLNFMRGKPLKLPTRRILGLWLEPTRFPDSYPKMIIFVGFGSRTNSLLLPQSFYRATADFWHQLPHYRVYRVPRYRRPAVVLPRLT